MRKASLCEEVRSAGANSWIVSSVDMTLRKTVQSDLPKGMEMVLSPLFSRSNSTSERNTRILETSISETSASKVRSTACTASTASANTLCP